MATEEERQAKVVVTADTTAYNRNIKASAEETNKLTAALNKVTASMDGIVKRAGKKMIMFGAADLASLGTASTVTATLQKQMTDLSTTASLIGPSMDTDRIQQGLRAISREVPIARGEIVQLASSINQMGIVSTKQITGMTKAFVELGAATQESAPALAQAQISFSRQMGTLGRTATMTAMNDSLTMLSATGGVPAQSIVEFGKMIAPAARFAGIGQKQTMGISTAFNRADAEGMYAANMFSQLANEITLLKQTRSPELGRYGNAIGVTRTEMQNMDMVQFFDRLMQRVSGGGTQSLQILSQLGFSDSPRAMRALQAVSAEGGIGKWINQATNPANAGKTGEGAEAAFSGFFDSLEIMRNKFTDFAQVLGELTLGPMTAAVDVFNAILRVTQPFAEAITRVASALGGLGGIAAIGAGVTARAWAAAATPSLIKRGVSGSSVLSFRYGLRHGSLEAGGYGIPANDPMLARLDPMQPNHVGRINRWIYGAAHSMGERTPWTGEGRPGMLRTPINMGLMGIQRASRWLADETRQHYDATTVASGLDRIRNLPEGEEGKVDRRVRRRGFLRSFGAAALHGKSELFGDAGLPNLDDYKKLTPEEIAKRAEEKKLADETPYDTAKRKANEAMNEFKATMKQGEGGIKEFTAALHQASSTLLRTYGGERGAATADKMDEMYGNADAFHNKVLDEYETRKAQVIAAAEGRTIQTGGYANVYGVNTPSKSVGIDPTKLTVEEADAKKKSTKETYDNAKATAASKPVMTQFKETLRSVGHDIRNVGFGGARTFGSMTGGALGMGVHGAASLGRSAMGMIGGPMGVGMLAGGWLLNEFQSGSDLFKTNSQAMSDELAGMTGNVKLYNDALGLATQSLYGFNSALNEQSEPTSVRGAMTGQEAQAAGKDGNYTNPALKNMSEQGIKDYLLSLGIMDPQTAQAVASDVYRARGPVQGRKLINEYLNTTKGGMEVVPSANIDYKAYANSVEDVNSLTDIEGVGWKDVFFASRGGSTADAYYGAAQGENSPIRQLADMQIGTLDAKVDYYKKTFGTNKPQDKKMMGAITATESAKATAANLVDINHFSDIESIALAEQSLTAMLERSGLTHDDAVSKVKEINLRSSGTISEFENMSQADLEKWAYEKAFQGTPSGQEAGSWDAATSLLGGLEKQPYDVSTMATMKELGKMGAGFKDFGKDFAESTKIQEAILKKQGDPKASMKAEQELISLVSEQTGNSHKQVSLLQALADKSPGSQAIAQAAIERIQAAEQRKLMGTNMGIRYQDIVAESEAATAAFKKNPNDDNKQRLKDALASEDQMRRELYVKLRDWHRQMEREEVEYQISLTRMKRDYRLQQKYSEEDFQRQQRYSRIDFNRSMRREEKDHTRQLQRSNMDAAMATNPFSRTMSQATAGPRTVIANMKDHVQRYRQARRDLNKLKSLGLSIDSIDMMNLTDPNLQQELHRLAATATRAELEKMNQLTDKTLDATKAMTQTDDNRRFRESEQDRRRNIRHSVKDFERGAERSEEAFIRSMKRADEAQHKQLRRMDRDRERSIRNATKDMLGWVEDVKMSSAEVGKELAILLGDSFGAVGDKLNNQLNKAVKNYNRAMKIMDGKPKSDFSGSASGSVNAGIDIAGTLTAWLRYQADPDIGRRKSGMADGGIVTKPRLVWVGEGYDDEAIIPLNRQGIDTLYEAINRHKSDERNPGKAWHVAKRDTTFEEARNSMAIYNSNTNFNGAITVVTNDPDDMIRKLQHKARMKALRGNQPKASV